MAAERMRKAKILFRDTLDAVIDPDPNGGLPGSAASALASTFKGKYPLVYKCKKCRRTLATAFNLLPHVQDESPIWTASKWSLPTDDVLEAAAENGLKLCSGNNFVLVEITIHSVPRVVLTFKISNLDKIYIFRTLMA